MQAYSSSDAVLTAVRPGLVYRDHLITPPHKRGLWKHPTLRVNVRRYILSALVISRNCKYGRRRLCRAESYSRCVKSCMNPTNASASVDKDMTAREATGLLLSCWVNCRYSSRLTPKRKNRKG